MRLKFVAISMLIAAALPGLPKVVEAVPAYTIEPEPAVPSGLNAGTCAGANGELSTTKSCADAERP